MSVRITNPRMNLHHSIEIQHLQAAAEDVALTVLAANAEAVDREALWPRLGMHSLAQAGLTGLAAPKRLGGHGQGLLGLAVVTETLAKGCASTAMCFGMHCVATAVIAAKSTPHHDETYLRPIGAGRHVTTLALSESGTGAHFFYPQTALRHEDAEFVIDGRKEFVTNGGYADSYVVSTLASRVSDAGEFSCLVVEAGLPGSNWGEPWLGFGMRGNQSRSLKLEGVRGPEASLLGAQGDQVWYVFEVVAPYFLTAMAATYVGVAAAALEITVQHLKSRRHSHSGQSLSEIDLVQHRVGRLWTEVEKSRLLLHHASSLGDNGSADALTAILASKADAARTAVDTTNEALTLCGGSAYHENDTLTRLLRDARAAPVMSPTTDMLDLWIGRSVLGVSLL